MANALTTAAQALSTNINQIHLLARSGQQSAQLSTAITANPALMAAFAAVLAKPLSGILLPIPVPSSPADLVTIANLQAQVKVLTDRIATLIPPVPVPGTPAPAPAPAP